MGFGKKKDGIPPKSTEDKPKLSEKPTESKKEELKESQSKPEPLSKVAEKPQPQKLPENLNERFNLGDVNATPESSSSGRSSNTRIELARTRIWKDLRESLDIKNLAAMDMDTARKEITSAVREISRFRELDLSEAEQSQIARECGDDMLGFGPLEPLLERDDIADIMINGPDTTFIEVGGRIEKASIKFRDNAHLVSIAQRIVGAIGRRVDESSPICDARLPDGSRVNAIIPPLAVDGATLTIRKFKKDKL
jgi:pilus assembly protein CpaF